MASSPQGPAKRLNPGTLVARSELLEGYVAREKNLEEHIENVCEHWGIGSVYRFDLGQNNDGCAPEVARRFEKLHARCETRELLKDYPAFRCRPLREKLGALHGVPADWLIVSAGIEQTIGLLAAAFLGPGDRVCVNRPSFFVFENFSRRMGAVPVRLELGRGDEFNWSEDTFSKYSAVIEEQRPKIVWIANPNNPTGLSVPGDLIERIVRRAAEHDTLVVVDEAYGEYTDPPAGVDSSSSLLHRYKNLLVMRTFSKAYGLASIRVGYAISSNTDVLGALLLHSYNYPITQFSLEIAECAVEHIDYLEVTRRRLQERRKEFMHGLSALDGIEAVASDCSIMMVRQAGLSARELTRRLERHGIFTARIPGGGEVGDNFIRINLGKQRDNRFLLRRLAETGAQTEGEAVRHAEEARWSDFALEGQQ